MIEADISFRSPSEGGRSFPDGIFKGRKYHPHIVLGDPNQKAPIVAANNAMVETYYGVSFDDGPDHVEFGKTYRFRMAITFWNANEFQAVVTGAIFTLREGGHIIGQGQIVRDWIEKQ